MLATFVIGLREGLEAALIVGMVAAFLRRNGASLKPLWLGVTAAVLLSAGVGLVLELLSAALPQQQQEALETVIGVAAVGIVTFMIVWMSRHARSLKSVLEAQAGSALASGSILAMATMAFLAVLREGVETAVFMVAAFQSALNPLTAGGGALLGLALAALVGVLLFRGAIALNLAKFFTVTGVFLVFVAAGLVMKSLRTAHEAGWVNLGQGLTVDLSALAPTGSTRLALLTGVFGIPHDPRLVEVLGWALYLVPMLAFVLWPRNWRPGPARLPRVQVSAAAGLALVAVMLVLVVPRTLPAGPSTTTAPLTSASGAPAGTVRLGAGTTLLVTDAGGVEHAYALRDHGGDAHAGISAEVFTASLAATAATGPALLSVSELAGYNGGRLPVGISATSNPGPFAAAWAPQGEITAWVTDGVVLDAVSTEAATLTLSGGGLATARTVVVANEGAWQVPAEHVSTLARQLITQRDAVAESMLWRLWLPAVLVLAALWLAGTARRHRRRPGTMPAALPSTPPGPPPRPAR